MIIKKFQGKTKEEALECAKKELGEGIVEMNVKTVKAKGLLGVFKGTKDRSNCGKRGRKREVWNCISQSS